MNCPEDSREWHCPNERRAWPVVNSVQQCLAALGLSFERMSLEPVGARSVKLTCGKGNHETRFCLVRQRTADPRIVCPLTEEHRCLQQLHGVCPALVPEPIGLIQPEGGEQFLVLAWVRGEPLGSRLQIRERAEDVSAIIVSALSALHAAGRRCNLTALTRQIIVNGLFAVAARSPLRGSLVPPAAWDRAIEAARAAAQSASNPTLLHCDAHAYNLMETPDGPCWLDFECLAVGPPEMDYARAWVLLQAQAEREVSTSQTSMAQLACYFLASSSFLESPPHDCSTKARSTIETVLRLVTRRMQAHS